MNKERMKTVSALRWFGNNRKGMWPVKCIPVVPLSEQVEVRGSNRLTGLSGKHLL